MWIYVNGKQNEYNELSEVDQFFQIFEKNHKEINCKTD